MNFSELVQEGTALSGCVVAVVLCLLGHRVKRNQPWVTVWGMRLAFVFLIGFVVAAFTRLRTPNDNVAGILLTTGMLTAILLGTLWLVFGVVGFIYGHYQSAVKQLGPGRRKRRRSPAPASSIKSSDRLTSTDEPSLAELQKENEQAAAELQARENARVACELFYNLRELDITDRFPRAKFDTFVEKFMGNDKPVDAVEARAGELQKVIQQHYEIVKPPEKFESLGQLAEWYESQKKEIEELPITEVYREDYLVRLNERYCELSERIMESL